MLSQFDLTSYSQLLEKTYERKNMILVLNNIIEEIKSLYKQNVTPSLIAPELTL